MNNGHKKCIFIINLLKKNGPMTKKQILENIAHYFPSDAKMANSTWWWTIDKIEKETPYRVCYDKKVKGYRVHTSPYMKGHDNSLIDYLMSSYNVTQSANMLIKHADIVYNADVISGTSAIDIIMHAIDESRGLTFTYTSFVNNTVKTRNYIPYFLSSWEGRWYLVAEVDTHPGSLYTYALDRMSDIKLSFEKVRKSVSITAKEYFCNSYGIQHAKPDEAIDIIIRVFGTQVKYVKSRKMHPSQEEIASCDEYTDFHLHLAPCYNFYQQLLWHRENIEVLAPDSVRVELKGIIEKLYNKYN